MGARRTNTAANNSAARATTGAGRTSSSRPEGREAHAAARTATNIDRRRSSQERSTAGTTKTGATKNELQPINPPGSARAPGYQYGVGVRRSNSEAGPRNANYNPHANHQMQGPRMNSRTSAERRTQSRDRVPSNHHTSNKRPSPKRPQNKYEPSNQLDKYGRYAST